MVTMRDAFQSSDWKTEKHVPVIEAPDIVRKGELLQVKVLVGKEIPHPNTTAHHIRWIDLYFKPDDEKFPHQIGHQEFASHGESVQGPDTSSIYTQPEATFMFKTEKAGTLLVSSYCNIHGLWDSTKELKIE